MSLKTISTKVTGKVQGVWYRNFTLEKANELGVCGFVKNMNDESVFILATGAKEQLKLLIEWCWIGSPKSKVDGVEITHLPLQQFQTFEIQRMLF